MVYKRKNWHMEHITAYCADSSFSLPPRCAPRRHRQQAKGTVICIRQLCCTRCPRQARVWHCAGCKGRGAAGTLSALFAFCGPCRTPGPRSTPAAVCAVEDLEETILNARLFVMFCVAQHGLSELKINVVSMCVIYLYTCECDIYKLMNRGMREGDAKALELWRPFIYYLVLALRLLPTKRVSVFRGIGIKFNYRWSQQRLPC